MNEPPQPAPDQVQEPPRSFNPIVGYYPVRRFGFLHRRPPVDPTIALVFATLRKGLVEFGPKSKKAAAPTMGELLWSGIRTVYEVDTGLHTTSIRTELPSASEAFAFQAEIDCRWSVQNPKLIVTHGIRDVREVLAPVIFERLRGVTRGYEIENAAKAETAANQEIRAKDLSEEHLGEQFGLTVEPFVRLTMDSQTREHAENMRGVERYRVLIAAGDIDQFALLLHQNPTNSAAVLRRLMEDRDQDRRQTVEFVNKLMESGALERWEIDDQVRVVLDWLKEATDRVIKPAEEVRPLSVVDGTPSARIVPMAGGGNENGTARTAHDRA